MKKVQFYTKYQSGFSLIEVILATSVFALLVTALAGSYIYGQEATMLAGNRAQAVLLAEEGLEAVRNIRDADFANISNGTHGLAITGNQWTLSGSSDSNGIFTRSVTIVDVDSDRKTVSCTVSWQQNASRSGSVTAVTRLTNWQEDIPPVSSCNAYALQEGYTSGICRQNVAQCAKSGETYLSDGDQFCTGGPAVDTCCALP